MIARTEEQLIERIATIVHAANCGLQEADGDPAPAIRTFALEDAELCGRTIRGVQRARMGMLPKALHDHWCADMRAHGWTYGEIKDREARTHPCLLPWEKLPEHQRDKDRLLWAITRALTSP